MKKEIADLVYEPKYLDLLKKNPGIANIIRRVIDQELTYLEAGALCDLTQVVLENEERGIKGVIIEAGCALGGSSICIVGAKSVDRKFFIYDVFGMIPPPSNKDGPDVWDRYKDILDGKSEGIYEGIYYGYETNLYQKVVDTFADFGFAILNNNIDLIKGLYVDTLNINLPISLAHIDCD